MNPHYKDKMVLPETTIQVFDHVIFTTEIPITGQAVFILRPNSFCDLCHCWSCSHIIVMMIQNKAPLPTCLPYSPYPYTGFPQGLENLEKYYFFWKCHGKSWNFEKSSKVTELRKSHTDKSSPSIRNLALTSFASHLVLYIRGPLVYCYWFLI